MNGAPPDVPHLRPPQGLRAAVRVGLTDDRSAAVVSYELHAPPAGAVEVSFVLAFESATALARQLDAAVAKASIIVAPAGALPKVRS